MGILTLLRELSPAAVPTHLFEWRGHTLGVDAMGWLHRAAFSCATELARSEKDRAAHPTAYLKWLQRMLHMCRTLGVQLLVVFDGAPLPAKSGTNAARDALRAANRARADELYAAGQREAAGELYSRCVSVSTAMRRNFAHLLRSEGVPFIVAPFEADAQLAALYLAGRISGAITEDSDLLAFGCERLLLKLDRSGNARLLTLQAVRNGKWDKQKDPVLFKMQRIVRAHRTDEELALTAVSTAPPASAAAASVAAASSPVPPVPSAPPIRCEGHDRFLHACVLSGCDYLPSLHGIGLKKAVSLVDEHRLLEPLLYHLRDARKRIEARWKADRAKAAKAAAKAAQQMLSGAELDGSPSLEDEEAAVAAALEDSENGGRMSTSEYIAHYYRALLTFQHQLVYDMDTMNMRHLTPLPPQLQRLWDKSVRAASSSGSGSQQASQEKEVLLIDDDEEESKQGANSTGSQTASGGGGGDGGGFHRSSAFPTFRDVTDATAAYERFAAAGFVSGSDGDTWPPPFPPGHPCLSLSSFDFLGSPLPPDVSATDWVEGRISSKTMRPYAPGFRPTEVNSASSAAAASDQGAQRPGFKRQTSAVTPGSQSRGAIANFFGRSSSALPFSTPAPASRPSGLSFTSGSAPLCKPFSLMPTLRASRKQTEQDDFSDLFDDDGGGGGFGEEAPTACAAAAATELDDDDAALWEMALWDAAADAEAGPTEGVAGEIARQDAAATAADASTGATQPLEDLDMTAVDDGPSSSLSSSSQPLNPPSSLNPFALPVRVRALPDAVATLADALSKDEQAPARTKLHSVNPGSNAPLPPPSASMLMSKLFGTSSRTSPSSVAAAPAAASASRSPSTAASAVAVSVPMTTPPRQQLSPPASASSSSPAAVRTAAVPATATAEAELCDLTEEDAEDAREWTAAFHTGALASERSKTGQTAANHRPPAVAEATQAASPAVKRKTSAPASAPPIPRRVSPAKRQKSLPATPAGSATLLNFFGRKSAT